MIDIYLRLPSAGAWHALGIEPDAATSIYEVGVIVRVIDDTDPEHPVTDTLPGWHVNIRVADDRDMSAVQDFIVTPAHPSCVWAE